MEKFLPIAISFLVGLIMGAIIVAIDNNKK